MVDCIAAEIVPRLSACTEIPYEGEEHHIITDRHNTYAMEKWIQQNWLCGICNETHGNLYGDQD